ncbi:MAG: hypothetical protein IKF80_08165 [Erysipelotrichaceae bacterium]|nr:hypothetical protein [Erysipelotrichaceae bacterium]
MAGVFKSLVNVALTWGSGIGALALIFCGFKYATASDQQSASQAKSWFIRILIGMVIVFAANAIMVAVERIGGKVNLDDIDINN